MNCLKPRVRKKKKNFNSFYFPFLQSRKSLEESDKQKAFKVQKYPENFSLHLACVIVIIVIVNELDICYLPENPRRGLGVEVVDVRMRDEKNTF